MKTARELIDQLTREERRVRDLSRENVRLRAILKQKGIPFDEQSV